ncbi:MAG: hypothetical protein ABL967_20335, partial [Bryobacteraceae bacterium]
MRNRRVICIRGLGHHGRAFPVTGIIMILLAIMLLQWAMPASANCPTASSPGLPAGCVGSECQCLSMVDPVCYPPEKILKEFKNKGACEAFGKPLTRARPRLAFGGEFQTFERGEIANYPNFDKDPLSPGFMLSAYQKRTPTPPYTLLNKIMVQWGPTAPHSYDKFVVRWDRENNEKNVKEQHKNDNQQIDVDGGKSGFYEIDASDKGVYAIYVAGCDKSFLGYTTCPQGWSFPVYVDRLPRALQAVPAPPTNPALFITSGGILDVPDQDKILIPEQFGLLAGQCGDLRDMDKEGGHYGELGGGNALAWLRAAGLITAKPLPPPGMSLPHTTDP